MKNVRIKRILAGAVAFAMSLSALNIAALAVENDMETYAVGDEAVTVYPSADIQFRKGNNTNFSTTNSLEIRHGSEADNSFLGGLKFDLSGIDKEDIKTAKLYLVTERRAANIWLSAKPFSDDWSEGSSNKYDDKTEIIQQALAAETISDFQVTYGGKTLFETGVTDNSEDISKWTSQINVTQYVTEQLSDEDTQISILITPKSDVTTVNNGVIMFSKDVSKAGYGSNSNRWDAIMAAFDGVSEDNYDLLKPRLVITYKTEDDIPKPTVLTVSGETDINSFGGYRAYTYTAKVFDQDELEMTEEAVVWSSQSTADEGAVSIDSDGNLSVPANTPEQTVTITAACVSDDTVSDTIEVNIICKDESLESPLLNGVRMRGKNASNPNSLLYNLYPEIGNELGMNANAAAILRFDISNTLENRDYLSKITLNLKNSDSRYKDSPLGAWLYEDPNDNGRSDNREWIDADWTNSSNASKSNIRNNISLVLGADDYEANGISGSSMLSPLVSANIDSDGDFDFEFSGDKLNKLLSYADLHDNIVDIVVTRGNLDAVSGRTEVALADSYLSMNYSEPASIKIFKGNTELESGESIELDSLDLPAQFQYSAQVYNTDGNKMLLTPEWSFKTTAKSHKIRFNLDTGKMTIPSDAVNQTVTVTASAEGVKKSIVIEIVDKLVPDAIEIDGADSINNYISSQERKYTYTAAVKDQFGNDMDDPEIEWDFETTAEENKASFKDGILTVPAGVADQTITITAKSGNITASKTVTVSKTIVDLPETFTAVRSMKLRGLGNSSDMQYDTEQEEIGMFAGAAGIFRVDISDIINNGAESAVTGMDFTLYRQTTSGSLSYGLWEYKDPEDDSRTDGKEWRSGDWTGLAKSDMLNNYSLIFGMDDLSSGSATYADGRDSYISPIASSSIDSSGKCTFSITGDALYSILENAKTNGGYAEFVVTSADLDERTVSTKPHFYMTGANDQYLPSIKVTYDLPSTPRSIKISGEDTLYINSRVSQYTSPYSAAVYDQSGELYEDQEIEWSFEADAQGVEFNTETGVITVKNTSGEGTVTIKAVKNYAVGTKTIIIKKISDGFKNGTFEAVDDSYLADSWTPNVPVYKVNFDDTDYYTELWNDARTNDAGTIFTRTQRYALNEENDETTQIRGSSGINSVVKMQYSTALSDEDALDLMNSMNQSIGVNNAKDGAYMQVGYEIPYYYLLDYYLSSDSQQMLSNQGIYIGLEFRNKADTAYLSSVATGDSYAPFIKGQWRTFIGTFTSGTANQINSQTRVNIGMRGMKGTGYIDYFRLVPKGIDTQSAYEGQNSMYVANTLEWTSDIFSVEGGSYYTYIASVKPETSIAEGQVTYTFMDSNFNIVGEYIVNTQTGEWSGADDDGWKTTEGQVAIPSGASICSITVSNPDKEGGVWFDNLVFTKTEDAKADVVRITGGNSEVVIPDSGETLYQYTAVVYDQYNNVISSDINWSVTSAAGMSINSNGILKVQNTASEGSVTITVSKDGKTASKTVLVIKKGNSDELNFGEYGLNGSFLANDGTNPYGWTNEGRKVIHYTFDSGIESWRSINTNYGSTVDGMLDWDSEQNHSENTPSGSMLIYNPGYNMPGAQIPNDVQIQGGMPYEFEMYFKQKNVTDDSLIRTNLRYFNSTGGTIAETPNMLRYYPNEYSKNSDENGWQRWYGTEVIPYNATKVRMEMRFRGGLNNSDGYAWFDDVKVSKITHLDKDNAYNGNPSLMLIGYNEDVTTAGREYGERWISDRITNISGGNSYEYSAMVQTYAVDSGAYLSFIFYDASGNEISTVKSEKVTDTTNSWVELSGSVVAPGDAKSAAIAYNLDGTGTAWISGISFDTMTDTDISGIKISGAGSIKIPSSGKKTSSYTVNSVNSNGNAVSAADAQITASGLPTGVTFENGVITVSSSAKTGSVTLRATYGGFSDTKTVKITDSSEASSGGGGGGGGSSGGSTVTIKTNPTTIDTTDSNPMGHVNYGYAGITSANSSGSGATEIPSLLQAPDINYFTGGSGNVIFKDIDGVPWAKNSIEALYRAGVVVGKDDKIFAPYDNVTRAEFITMLVKTFRLTSDNKDNSFTDVNDDDWYKDYVNIAVDKGIINGIRKDYFGAAQNITRQDAAVMCQRLWDSLNKEMTGPYKASFTDYDSISDYALEAVTNLAEVGIIKGMDTGEFAPQNNTTRAQAAVIIYGMAVKYDE